MKSVNIECCVVVLLFFQFCTSSSNDPNDNNQIFSYKSLSSCKKNEYYDWDRFTCESCDVGLNLIPTDDHLGCKCHPDWSTNILYDATQRHAICRLKCTKNCTTATVEPLAECQQLKYIGNNLPQKSLQVVHDDTKNCSCDQKFNSLYENFCISNVLLKDFLAYSSFGVQRPKDFADLKFVLFFCKFLRNATACNRLANLCVLSFYNLDKVSPCGHFYIGQASDAATYGGEELANVRPYLFFYRKGKELDRTIDYSYSLTEGSESSFLDLIYTSYSMNENQPHLGKLLPQNLDLCKNHKTPKYQKFWFGRNFISSCELTLEALIEFAQSPKYKVFTSIFLNHTIDGVSFLKPVPILIRNAFSNNHENSREDLPLVKRFFFFDAVSLQNNQKSQMYNNLKTIKYIERLEILVTIKEENKILPPLVTLQYKDVEIFVNSSLSDGHPFTFQITFKRRYSLDFCFEVLLPLLIALGFVFAILRTFNFKTRQNKEYYDFSALFEFLLYLLSNTANAFFAIVAGVSFYILLVATYQRDVKILVPIAEHEYLEILIWMSFWMKSIYLLFKFWRIAHIDIFFVDWERPKGFDPHLTIRSNLDTPSVCSSARSSISEAVSAWRNYFVANEWIKLSTKRKTSIFVQNLIVLIIIQVIKVEFPKQFTDKTLILAITILIYGCAYILQIVLIFIIGYRVLGNPIQQFIDICSTANISVFILLHDSYGFYIHGRSPHGFSDTDMSSMIIQLEREARNMCGKRGLLTGSDHQTYTILAPTHLRIYYNKLLTPFQNAVNLRSQIHFEEDLIHHKGNEFTLEKTAMAYSSVNRFFCAFIDHAIKDLDYIIKERTVIEALFDCEFENFLSESKGTFYIDNGHSFDKVLLYGNDSQQFLFEIIVFSSVLLATNSWIASAFITCFLFKIFQMVFKGIVKNNLAAKTLIDKRFLM